MAIRRIGQILVDLGFINDEQLEMLLEEQHRHPGELLGKIAEEMGLVTDEQVALALAEQMSMQVVKLGEIQVSPEVMELITEAMAQLYRVIPVKLEDNVLTLATCDPQNLSIQDELRTFLGYDIKLLVATERDADQDEGGLEVEEADSPAGKGLEGCAQRSDDQAWPRGR